MRFQFLYILLLHSFLLIGQTKNTAQNEGTALLFSVGLGAQQPDGDLSKRFGSNRNVGGGLDLLTNKNNFIIGIEGYYIFGNEVKENVLANIITPDGFVIGASGELAAVQLRQRGFYLGGRVGKLFSLSAKNVRSGIRVTVGAGLLQHQIRIQNDPLVNTPQLSDDYKKGYDRLTNGLAFNEFVGYQLLSTNKRINFLIGIELTQGFTQNRRDFNFDTRNVDAEKRVDLLWGIRVAWILPFYIGGNADNIYY